jgi:hypothetical protein
MSPFGSRDSASLWEDVKSEWMGVVFMTTLFFLFPTAGAACSGNFQLVIITAIAALPGSLLATAITVFGIRAMSGRSGLLVAKRSFGAWCVTMLLMLAIPFGLVVRYLILSDDPSLTALGWTGAALACVALAILWRMYRSGIAAIARSGHL